MDTPVTVTAKAKVNVQVQLGNTVWDQYSFRRTTTTERPVPQQTQPAGPAVTTASAEVEPANCKRHRSASCVSPQSLDDGGIYFAAKSSCASSADSIGMQDEVVIVTPTS